METGAYSVLMSVYHKESPDNLRAAMDSIFAQTVPTDDFVLVCDGPLNEALDAVISQAEAAHPELHTLRLPVNGGLGNALNTGLPLCRHELVARMDSDDLSLPSRCEKQLEAFSQDPSLSIVSASLEEFCGDEIKGCRILPQEDGEIRAFSRKRNPFSHPVVMFRKSDVLKAGSYNEEYHLFEDYYLWIRMLRMGCKGRNLPEVLLRMRVTPDAYQRRGGSAYARDLLRFHRWILSTGWTSPADFLTGAVPHAILCVMPNALRGFVYKTVLRK